MEFETEAFQRRENLYDSVNFTKKPLSESSSVDIGHNPFITVPGVGNDVV